MRRGVWQPLSCLLKASFVPSLPPPLFQLTTDISKASLCCCRLSSLAERVTKVTTLNAGQPFWAVLKWHQSSMCTPEHTHVPVVRKASRNRLKGDLATANLFFKNRSENGSTSCYVIPSGKLPMCLGATLLSELTGHFNAVWKHHDWNKQSQSRAEVGCFVSVIHQWRAPHYELRQQSPRNQSWQFRDTGIKR